MTVAPEAIFVVLGIRNVTSGCRVCPVWLDAVYLWNATRWLRAFDFLCLVLCIQFSCTPLTSIAVSFGKTSTKTSRDRHRQSETHKHEDKRRILYIQKKKRNDVGDLPSPSLLPRGFTIYTQAHTRNRRTASSWSIGMLRIMVAKM